MKLTTIAPIVVIAVLSVLAQPKQKDEEVTVHGRVTDLFGNTLDGVTLQFYTRSWFKAPAEVKFAKSTTTDGQGNYSVSGLSYGYYVVSAELRGFRYAEVSRAFLGRGDNLLDLGLEEGALTDLPSIEISGTVRSVDKTAL